MKNKQDKNSVGDVIINIIVVIILIFVFIMTLNILLSNGKGYISMFGTSAIAVKTDSMNGDQADSFAQGDLIFIKILEGNEHTIERQNLQVGQIVVYISDDVDGDGRQDLISHRIVDTEVGADGTVMNLLVKGDNPMAIETTKISTAAVIGVYTGKISGLGNFFIFIHQPMGFGLVVVLPSVLIVVYCAYVVIKNIKDTKKATEKTVLTEEEKEKIRAEVIAEMNSKENGEK
ncbi:MAG TPA: hypothetical protein P5087_05515 [Eubacteriales bacterium]|nr:hypothetical protein [Eubacteriales bacterium]